MKSLYFLVFAFLLWTNSSLFSQDYEIYVTGGNNDVVIKYDQSGENPETFVSANSGGLDWPQDIIFLEDQNVMLVSSFNDRSIKKYNLETGEFIENFATTSTAPTRMRIGEDSLLYVLPWAGQGQENPIARYDLDGNFIDNFSEVGVSQAIGMAWDEEGNFYVSSYGGGYVRKYDAEGNDLGFFINSSVNGPTNIWFADNGDMIVLNWDGGNATRFDSEGNFLEIFISGLSQPEGVAFLPNGNFLIGNGGTDQVKEFESDGTFVRNWPTTGVTLDLPNAVVIRNLATVDIPEVPVKEVILVSPTMGTSFSFVHEMEDVEQVEIYDVKGVLVARKAVQNGVLWEAQQAAEGVYVLLAKIKSGAVYSQKIVVSK